MEQKTKRF